MITKSFIDNNIYLI